MLRLGKEISPTERQNRVKSVLSDVSITCIKLENNEYKNYLTAQT